MKKQYKCLTNDKLKPWNIKGVNLGGLFVLEPWITPSLFYQFLNEKDQDKVAMDTYTFCKNLEITEASRQFKEHLKNWVNESHIKFLSENKVTHLRIPVGDWMFTPYYPYIGCTDYSLQYLDKIMNLCDKYSLKVLLDLHGVKNSQNGLDNSGQSSNIQYVVAPINKEYDGTLTFIHWPIVSANWIGEFNTYNKTYDNINNDNILFTKNVLYKIIEQYKNHPALYAIEPLNEPWIYTPINILKDFYYDVYKYMYLNAPHLKFIYHDSFRTEVWKNFLTNCSNVALDWHIYQAWNIERYGDQFLLEADNYKTYISKMNDMGVQLVVGEFSLATDNCAMWLNGFQDNLEGFPITSCKYAPCPFPYINVKDFDRTKNIISPFGTGLSTPLLGTCPYEGLLLIDDSQNEFLNKLLIKKINSFDTSHGWFFWNFRTEYEKEITWSFEASLKNQYFKGSTFQPINELITTKVIFLLFFIGILGLISILLSFCKKGKVKEYRYIQIEVPGGEKEHINMYKKNASTGNISNYDSINV
jgi:glucan 1,3-beta-glucosidase